MKYLLGYLCLTSEDEVYTLLVQISVTSSRVVKDMTHADLTSHAVHNSTVGATSEQNRAKQSKTKQWMRHVVQLHKANEFSQSNILNVKNVLVLVSRKIFTKCYTLTFASKLKFLNLKQKEQLFPSSTKHLNKIWWNIFNKKYIFHGTAVINSHSGCRMMSKQTHGLLLNAPLQFVTWPTTF